MKHSENETFNDSFARLGVQAAGTSRVVTTSNLFPNTQVPPPGSSLVEYYDVYNLPGLCLSFIISLQGILFSPFPTYICIFQQRISCQFIPSANILFAQEPSRYMNYAMAVSPQASLQSGHRHWVECYLLGSSLIFHPELEIFWSSGLNFLMSASLAVSFFSFFTWSQLLCLENGPLQVFISSRMIQNVFK